MRILVILFRNRTFFVIHRPFSSVCNKLLFFRKIMHSCCGYCLSYSIRCLSTTNFYAFFFLFVYLCVYFSTHALFVCMYVVVEMRGKTKEKGTKMKLKESISSSSTNREQNHIVHKAFYLELSYVCLLMDNLRFVLESNLLNQYELHHK